jgi:hypothetical protein
VLDADDYFWLPTEPAYTTKRPAEERDALLLADLTPNAVLSGSVHRWADAIQDTIGLIVLVDAPTEVRLDRLRRRELAELGFVDEAFIEYAASYDDPSFTGRSRAMHERWIVDRAYPVLHLDGTAPVEVNVAAVLQRLAG